MPGLRGDREQLIQALLNIVRNAATALAARIAAEALATGRTVRELAAAYLPEGRLDEILDPASMTYPRAVPGARKG